MSFTVGNITKRRDSIMIQPHSTTYCGSCILEPIRNSFPCQLISETCSVIGSLPQRVVKCVADVFIAIAKFVRSCFCGAEAVSPIATHTPILATADVQPAPVRPATPRAEAISHIFTSATIPPEQVRAAPPLTPVRPTSPQPNLSPAEFTTSSEESSRSTSLSSTPATSSAASSSQPTPVETPFPRGRRVLMTEDPKRRMAWRDSPAFQRIRDATPEGSPLKPERRNRVAFSLDRRPLKYPATPITPAFEKRAYWDKLFLQAAIDECRESTNIPLDEWMAEEETAIPSLAIFLVYHFVMGGDQMRRGFESPMLMQEMEEGRTYWSSIHELSHDFKHMKKEEDKAAVQEHFIQRMFGFDHELELESDSKIIYEGALELVVKLRDSNPIFIQRAQEVWQEYKQQRRS